MALYSPSTYDSFHAKYTHEQCVKGGQSRAIKAKRNNYGLFLPANCELTLPENYVHGRAGGLARAKQQKEQK